jgi:hypothetical protein
MFPTGCSWGEGLCFWIVELSEDLTGCAQKRVGGIDFVLPVDNLAVMSVAEIKAEMAKLSRAEMVRFALGPETAIAEIDRAVEVVVRAAQTLRRV